MAKVKADKSPTIVEGNYEVPDGLVKELNFFDMTGAKAGTKGTSNKFYHIELQAAKDGKCQLYTEYGPTGKVQCREWRYFDEDRAGAEKELARIVKSKEKKGYVVIDVASRALGSSEAQKQTKHVDLKNADSLKKVGVPVSKLNSAQKQITDLFFGYQADFVVETLNCPLGQLTNKQIDLGRSKLDEAKDVVNARADKKLTKSNLTKLEGLTNDFYGSIPHNLGQGARGQMSHLLLDTLDKIVQKESDLDTLLDAKQVNAVLKQDSTIDDRYNTLNCDFDEIPARSPLHDFLVNYFDKTKVHGHGYDQVKVKRIWSMKRKDAKEEAFLTNAERIAKSAGRHTFADDTLGLSNGQSKLWTPDNRPDLSKEERALYNKSNVWLSWHGTRSANLVGITRRGLLVRPTGAVHTGSMFGDGKYFAWQSTKSLNYCDGGYWTGGSRTTKKYMFLMDTAFGKMHQVQNSQFFREPPRGYHSVYGKAGGGRYGGLRNDEIITYDFEDKDNQSSIRYLFEIA